MSGRLRAGWLIAALSAAAWQVQAQAPARPPATPPASPLASPTAAAASAAAPVAMADGEVRKIDTEAGKLTLRHGPIAHLDMPGMTMVFRVADRNMLAGLKPGDKLRFSAERIQGAITITAIERAPPP